jgi:plastocyanin
MGARSAMRAAALLIPLLVAAVLLAGCSSNDPGNDNTSNTGTGGATPGGALTTTSSAGGSSQDLMVSMVDNRFVDGDKSVPVGSSIMYMNEGSHAHTVTIHWTGEDASLTRINQTLQPGQDVTFTFDQKGTYHVWCRFHGTMTTGMASVVTVT